MSTSKRSKTDKGKSVAHTSSYTPKPKRPFFDNLAENRFITLSKRSIISGRFVVLQDFEHLGIPHIVQNNSLSEFLTIREPVYTSLMPYFYANISFEGDQIRSRVLGRDIDIGLRQFADILHLSTDG